jgi:hypothetical protein
MAVERCEECGFDSDDWTDSATLDAIAALPAQWQQIVVGPTPADLGRRLLPNTSSIGEYIDHVREVLFGMRFVLDVVTTNPGTDLGDAPEPRFDPEPRPINVSAALAGIAFEAKALGDRLEEVPDSDLESYATLDGGRIDVRWVARHAVHDATHHLFDVQRLRAELERQSV